MRLLITIPAWATLLLGAFLSVSYSIRGIGGGCAPIDSYDKAFELVRNIGWAMLGFCVAATAINALAG